MAPYKKLLEGIGATKELRQIYKSASRCDATQAASASSSNTTSTATNYVPGRPLTLSQATALMRDFQLLEKDYFPIPVVRAMQVILQHDSQKAHLLPLLETAVRQAGLVFTPPPPPVDDECQIVGDDDGDKTSDDNATDRQQRHYRQRMRRLRLRNEQAKYSAITQNLGSMNAVQDDGITTKSMTYAASVGLNMIVAPLSFGVFMYFFAGAVLDRFFAAPPSAVRAVVPDIKRVIAGVVSGVLMLFIEMILFVIRTHEMDKALRRKERKSGNQGPFGYYTATSSKTFTDR